MGRCDPAQSGEQERIGSGAPERAVDFRCGGQGVKADVAQQMRIESFEVVSGALPALSCNHADRGRQHQPRERGEGGGAEDQRFGG